MRKSFKIIIGVLCMAVLNGAIAGAIGAPLPEMDQLIIYGKVVCAPPPGVPVPGAIVKFQPKLNSKLPSFSTIYTKTSSNGKFKTKILFPKGISFFCIYVEAYKPNSNYIYHPSAMSQIEICKGNPKNGDKIYCELQLKQSDNKAAFSGYVYDSMTGHPIPNISVNVLTAKYSRKAITDSKGFYYLDFEIDSPKWMKIYVDTDEYPIGYIKGYKSIYANIGSEYELDFNLSHDPNVCYIHGRVTDIDGDPIPYVLLYANKSTLSVNADWLGYYRFTIKKDYIPYINSIKTMGIPNIGSKTYEIVEEPIWLDPQKGVYIVDFELKEK